MLQDTPDHSEFADECAKTVAREEAWCTDTWSDPSTRVLSAEMASLQRGLPTCHPAGDVTACANPQDRATSRENRIQTCWNTTMLSVDS